MAAENNLHQGHRERMRERIAQQGFESLADHEALEVLLYLTNPRKNTNVMAHALHRAVRQISARVLDAEEEELCKVEGVGPCHGPDAASHARKSANTIPAAAPVSENCLQHYRAAGQSS